MSDADKQRIAHNVAVCRRREALSLAVQFLSGERHPIRTESVGRAITGALNVAESFRNYIENGVQQ